eukprot:gene16567-7990_t
MADQVVQAFVFGGAGNEALVTLSSGDVYSLGFNGNGCLGVGDSTSTMEPRKVEILCQKVLVDFAYGSGPHVLAVTGSLCSRNFALLYEDFSLIIDSGDIYSWGHGGYGQLGHGTCEKTIPVLIKTCFGDRKVLQAACGSYHSIALTSNGEVYGWGSNNCGQLGTGSTNNQTIPKRTLGLLLASKKVASVSCGQSFSVARTDEGELFAWGYNGNGQLGIGNTTNQHSPCKVLIGGGRVIVKVLCGMAHVLALSDIGELYSWGANSYGQIGVGNTLNTSVPNLINSVEDRWSDIAAHHYTHISAGLTVSNKVYMWGQCHGLTLLTPRKVAVSSLDEVFACFGMPQVMFRPITVDLCTGQGVKESIKDAFNDKESSDLTFLVEGEPIYVHKAILKISEIEISNFSLIVFKAFLKFLYTEEVDLPIHEAIGLLDLANLYCEEKLKQKCESLILQSISVENAAMLMEAAIKYNAKNLEDFCFHFIVCHLTAVTQTISFKALDGETVKNLIIKASEAGAFKR